MNKEYFVLEIEDTSSAEYRKNYWKKAAEILLERIYQREQCISEKVKNIIELCSLPEHRFFNVDVYMPKKRNKADTNYYALHYDFTYIQNEHSCLKYPSDTLSIDSKVTYVPFNCNNRIIKAIFVLYAQVGKDNKYLKRKIASGDAPF